MFTPHFSPQGCVAFALRNAALVTSGALTTERLGGCVAELQALLDIPPHLAPRVLSRSSILVRCCRPHNYLSSTFHVFCLCLA